MCYTCKNGNTPGLNSMEGEWLLYLNIKDPHRSNLKDMKPGIKLNYTNKVNIKRVYVPRVLNHLNI